MATFHQIERVTETLKTLGELDKELAEAGFPDNSTTDGLAGRLRRALHDTIRALRDRDDMRAARDHCAATLANYEDTLRGANLPGPPASQLAALVKVWQDSRLAQDPRRVEDLDRARRQRDEAERHNRELAAALTETRKDRDAVRTALDIMARDLTEAQENIRVARQEIAALTLRIGENRATIGSLVFESSARMRERDGARAELATVMRERNQLSIDLGAVRRECDVERTARRSAEASNDSLAQDSARLRAERDEARRGGSSVLLTDLNAACKKVAELERQVELLTADVKVFREQRDR